MEEKIIACNNSECKFHNKCKRYYLFENGAKEFTTNSGDKQHGCKKFIPMDNR